MTESAKFSDVKISIWVSTVAESIGRSPRGDCCWKNLCLVGIDDHHSASGVHRRGSKNVDGSERQGQQGHERDDPELPPQKTYY
jgi:hypothetical protein